MIDRIKQIALGVGAFAALAAGGNALANAAQHNGADTSPAAATQSADLPEPGDKPDAAGETADLPEPGDKPDAQDEKSDQLTAAQEQRASDAALKAVDGGKVNEASAEHQDGNEANDQPEKGDTPDPSYESKIAYDVEITKTDGSVVDVHLDKAFNVLGTQAADAGDR